MENIKKKTPSLTSNQGELTFRHRCSASDVVINFSSLNWSLTDISLTGLTNPPSWVITSSNLASLKQNFFISTSIGRIVYPEYYTLYNSSLTFTGFTPQEGEVLTFYVSNANRPAFNAEMMPINREGTFSSGASTFDFIDQLTIPTLAERCPIQVLASSEVDLEVKFTTESIPPMGYVSANGVSIGKNSGTYIGSDYFILFSHLWALSGLSTTVGDPFVISSTKGLTAQLDWDAGKTISLNLGGNFIRAFGGSSGVIGAKQLDQFQGHEHSVPHYQTALGTNNGLPTNSGNVTLQSVNTVGIVSDGTNGTPRTGSETRPQNVALQAYIRYRPEFFHLKYLTDWSFVPLSNDGSKSRSILLSSVSYNRVIKVIGISYFQPNTSVLPQIEILSGQLNRVISDVAQLSNKDLVDYLATANSIDVGYFSNTFYSLLNAQIPYATQGIIRFSTSTPMIQGSGNLCFPLEFIFEKSASDLFTVTNVSNVTRFTAKKSLMIHNAAISAYSSSTDLQLNLYKNGSIYYIGSQNAVATRNAVLSTPVTLEYGEYISFNATQSVLSQNISLAISAIALENKSLKTIMGI